jgi:ABC-type multidrug transport system ATPase subunit
LRKVYAGGKVAVRGLSYGVPVGEVFGFLGINGAGKTSTLEMLTGARLPSSGTALLAGYDILAQQPQVRRLLGYCPQWDALLELLTSREHLELYARIKGVPEPSVRAVVDEQLARFDLVQFANKKAGTLSGGNKRKLSVAIAMIGSPPLVFLDEPSTGMDPVARRFMWDVIAHIATERKECSMILTSHNLEEVEALCTRVGIMVGGRLRCLGSVQHLKHRFGRGFESEVRAEDPTPPQVDVVEAAMRGAAGGRLVAPPGAGGVAFIPRGAVRALAAALGAPQRDADISDTGAGWALSAAFARSTVPSAGAPAEARAIPLRDLAQWWAEEDLAANITAYITGAAFPGATLEERHGPQLRFKLPPQAESLSVVFAKLESQRAVLCIRSYSLGGTTLEQIFNYFAAQQEEERSVARGMAAVVDAARHPGAGAGSGGAAAGGGGGADVELVHRSGASFRPAPVVA